MDVVSDRWKPEIAVGARCREGETPAIRFGPQGPGSSPKRFDRHRTKCSEYTRPPSRSDAIASSGGNRWGCSPGTRTEPPSTRATARSSGPSRLVGESPRKRARRGPTTSESEQTGLRRKAADARQLPRKQRDRTYVGWLVVARDPRLRIDPREFSTGLDRSTAHQFREPPRRRTPGGAKANLPCRIRHQRRIADAPSRPRAEQSPSCLDRTSNRTSFGHPAGGRWQGEWSSGYRRAYTV